MYPIAFAKAYNFKLYHFGLQLIYYKQVLCRNRQIGTPETRFSEPQFSEVLDLMNKLQLPFSYFTLYSDSFSQGSD